MRLPYLFCLLGMQCSLMSPQITLVDQQTSLEKQVLGSYQKIGSDMLMVASVRAVEADGKEKDAPHYSDLHQQAIKAMQNQEFNRDDIDELKSKKLIGEALDGSIMLVESDSLPRKDRQFAEKLVLEENESRQVIWQRIIQLSENLSIKDIPKIRRAYAKMMHEKAMKGELIQTEEGKWVEKT